MSVIIPFNRRDYLLRPSVSLSPLPARAATEPLLALAARELGIDVGRVRWSGGIILVTPLTAADGLIVTVRACADSPRDTADYVESLSVFAPGSPRVHVASGQFGAGDRAEVPLRLRVPRSHMVAAVARHCDGRLTGVIAELRVTV